MPELSYARTVDRRLVHRSAVAEVFVTDVQKISERQLLVGAQLPLTHLYYSDHLQAPAGYDPLLLAEVCRQAAIAGAHLAGGDRVPPGTAMLVEHFALRLADPGALLIGTVPGELRIDNHFTATRERGRRVRAGHVEQRLFLDGVAIGDHRMQVQLVSVTEHDALRRLQRGSTAPSTADLEDEPHPGAVEPVAVGRVQQMNVVLADPVRCGPGLSATLAPRPGNRGLFDHEYDHLPAMTLTEAARQLALLSTGGDPTPDRVRVVAVTGRFARFAELDEPVTASTTTGPVTTAEHRTVGFTQGGAEIASITIGLVRTPTP